MDDKRIKAALVAVAREKCTWGFRIDSDDEKTFNAALRKIDSRKGDEYSTPVKCHLLENKTDETYSLPTYSLPQTSHCYEEKNMRLTLQEMCKGVRESQRMQVLVQNVVALLHLMGKKDSDGKKNLHISHHRPE